jgi:hypothetical protein
MHRVTMFAPIGMPSAIWLNMEILEFFDTESGVGIRPATVKVVRSQDQPVYFLEDPHPHQLVYEGAGVGVFQDDAVLSGQVYIYSGLVEWSPALWHAIVTLSASDSAGPTARRLPVGAV